MATLQVRDLDDEILEAYRHRAKLEGKSIQQYMKEYLTKQVASSTNREVFLEIERSGLLRESRATLEGIVADIRATRDAAS
ncbi:MAG: FitA-like ribbon-helix-helix domain-containing protein [Bryobacteraceae bacterium]